MNFKIRIHIKVKRRFLTAASLFILVCGIAQNSKFDINDPRNPNCPCHKYQKLADEEYAKMQRTGNKGMGELASRTSLRDDRIRKTRIGKYRKQKHKIKDKKVRTPRWIYKFKNWNIWKRVTDPGKCPVWNDR